MKLTNFNSLSEAVDFLTQKGYAEDFKAEQNVIKALYSKKEYAPKELKIVDSFRFEGETNPEDETVLFALISKDNVKGTLVMSYSATHSQNIDLIKQIKRLN